MFPFLNKNPIRGTNEFLRFDMRTSLLSAKVWWTWKQVSKPRYQISRIPDSDDSGLEKQTNRPRTCRSWVPPPPSSVWANLDWRQLHVVLFEGVNRSMIRVLDLSIQDGTGRWYVEFIDSRWRMSESRKNITCQLFWKFQTPICYRMKNHL